MARKRTIDEIDTFADFDHPVTSATIHGMVTSLSLMKKGRNANYFEGTVSDGTVKLRLIGFNSGQHKVMNDYLSNKQAVTLEDCEIKKRKQMEVMLKGTTKLNQSP